eukprot:15112934-Alexandrium_andersonii.AAC.1
MEPPTFGTTRAMGPPPGRPPGRGATRHQRTCTSCSESPGATPGAGRAKQAAACLHHQQTEDKIDRELPNSSLL